MDKVNTNTDLEEVQAEASAVSAPVQHSARGGVQCMWRCAEGVGVCTDCEVVLGGVGWGWGCTVV